MGDHHIYNYNRHKANFRHAMGTPTSAHRDVNLGGCFTLRLDDINSTNFHTWIYAQFKCLTSAFDLHSKNG